MAGSPGAGKTEFSKNLVRLFESTKNKTKAVRIDGDDLRSYFSGYTGNNAALFQGAISILVEKIHDTVLHNGQTFILDGTFSNYDRAARNVTRSLAKNRTVVIFYIYQEPRTAWKFTLAREITEGRNIPKKAFINQFLGAREAVDAISREFQDKVGVFLVRKNFETNEVEDIIMIGEHGKHIDDYIEERYTSDVLEELL